MAAWRRAIELSLGDEDTAKLRSIAQSRTEPASRVERARILLAYREAPSFYAVARALGLHHQTAQRCVERAVVEGPIAALDDRPRPGREPTITPEAKAWLVALACRKAKDLGYPHELWTTRLLARHARMHGPAEGHASRRLQPPPPTCRPSPVCIRVSPGSLSMNATARSACWPVSILSVARFMPWSGIVIAVANSSNSSSCSTPPIRPIPRSS